MAIQFQCPKCGAAIKVPDSGAGKVGRCPKCNVKIRVPEIEVPAEPATTGDSGPAATPPDVGPPPVEPESPPDAPVADVGEPDGELPFVPQDEETTSLARRVKMRQRTSLSAMLVPLVACGVFIALLVGMLYYFGVFSTKLTGELKAVAVPSVSLEPGRILKDSISVPDTTLELVLSRLEEDPLAPVTQLAEFEFRGTPGALEISLARGREAEFYVVRIAQSRHLKEFADKHREELGKPRRRALEAAAEKFVKEFRKAEQEDRPIDDLDWYRDELGVNALVGGLGFHLVAVFETTVEGRPAFARQRCVAEQDGNLYFLLPRGIQSFRIRGREVDGEVAFPGEYSVRVRRDGGDRAK